MLYKSQLDSILTIDKMDDTKIAVERKYQFGEEKRSE